MEGEAGLVNKAPFAGLDKISAVQDLLNCNKYYPSPLP